jgi:hypothetical protein
MGASLFDKVEWNNDNKLLYLKLAGEGISAGATNSFSFQLQNPLTYTRKEGNTEKHQAQLPFQNK